MKAFVINLSGDAVRLRHMREMFARIGATFERFDALDPERAAKHPGYSLVPLLRDREWVPGELACLLSHYEVWRAIAEGEEEFGMVLEDDVFVDPALARVLDGSCPVPPGADVVKLETGEYNVVALSRRAVATPYGFGYHRLHSVHYGAGAYAISRGAARVLIGSIGLFNMPVDDLLFTPSHPVGRKLRVWQAVPGLAIQNINLRPELRSADLGDGMAAIRAEVRAHREARKTALELFRDRVYLFRDRCRERALHFYAPARVVPFGVSVNSIKAGGTGSGRDR